LATVAALACHSRGYSPGRVLRASYPLEQVAEAFLAAREVPGKTWIRLP
jgi:hypothetical protein